MRKALAKRAAALLQPSDFDLYALHATCLPICFLGPSTVMPRLSSPFCHWHPPHREAETLVSISSIKTRSEECVYAPVPPYEIQVPFSTFLPVSLFGPSFECSKLLQHLAQNSIAGKNKRKQKFQKVYVSRS